MNKKISSIISTKPKPPKPAPTNNPGTKKLPPTVVVKKK